MLLSILQGNQQQAIVAQNKLDNSTGTNAGDNDEQDSYKEYRLTMRTQHTTISFDINVIDNHNSAAENDNNTASSSLLNARALHC